jgi:hypothetical protein
MAPTELLEAARNERVAAAMSTMLAQESPTETVELVDILSGSDGDAVTFTSAWETES